MACCRVRLLALEAQEFPHLAGWWFLRGELQRGRRGCHREVFQYPPVEVGRGPRGLQGRAARHQGVV